MSRVYRALAAALIALGLLITVWTAQAVISDLTHTNSPHAIKCDSRGCREILDNGSLADDRVGQPGKSGKR